MNEESIQKYIKQVRDEANKDMEHFMGALNERTDDKFKAVNERLDSINKTLGSHTNMLEELTKETPLTRVKISDHENRIAVLELAT